MKASRIMALDAIHDREQVDSHSRRQNGLHSNHKLELILSVEK